MSVLRVAACCCRAYQGGSDVVGNEFNSFVADFTFRRYGIKFLYQLRDLADTLHIVFGADFIADGRRGEKETMAFAAEGL